MIKYEELKLFFYSIAGLKKRFKLVKDNNYYTIIEIKFLLKFKII